MWDHHVTCHYLAQDLDKKSKVAKKLAPMVFEDVGGEHMHNTRQTHETLGIHCRVPLQSQHDLPTACDLASLQWHMTPQVPAATRTKCYTQNIIGATTTHCKMPVHT